MGGAFGDYGDGFGFAGGAGGEEEEEEQERERGERWAGGPGQGRLESGPQVTNLPHKVGGKLEVEQVIRDWRAAIACSSAYAAVPQADIEFRGIG